MEIMMLTDFGRIDKYRENFNKEIKYIRKSKTQGIERKNTITGLKNKLEGLNSRLDETEEGIIDLEDVAVELTQTEQQKEKVILKSKDILKDM